MSGFAWLAPPANNNLADAISINQGNTTVSANTTDATGEPGEVSGNCISIDDNQSAWWTFTPGSAGTLGAAIGSGSFDGARVSLWTAPSSGPAHPMVQIGCGINVLVPSASASETYYFRVSGETSLAAVKNGGDRGQLRSFAGNVNLDVVGPDPLPVELLYFDALVDGRNIELRWTTATESNNSGFDVEWRSRMNDWSSVDFVGGAGSTTEQQDYSFTVSDLIPDVYSFRLRQIDFDGAFEFSPVIEAQVDVPSTHHLVDAYPNPFNPQTQFTITVAQDQQVSVKLFDQQGRELRSLFAGELKAGIAQSISIDGSSLSSGTYIYQVTGVNFSESKTVSLVK